jgi:hypothetical protein
MKVQRVRYVHETPASVESLWATLEDYATWSSWGPWDVSEIERPGADHPAGVGAVRRLAIGRRVLREETTRFEPMREMRYTVLSGIPVRDYEGVVELEPVGDRTRITWSSSFHGAPAILGPIIRRSLQSKFGPIVTAVAAAAEAADRVRR